jgi:hypothetical protein
MDAKHGTVFEYVFIRHVSLCFCFSASVSFCLCFCIVVFVYYNKMTCFVYIKLVTEELFTKNTKITS